MKCNTCGKMNCMAHGGSVDPDHEGHHYQKGVEGPTKSYEGRSVRGLKVRGAHEVGGKSGEKWMGHAKESSRENLAEMKSMPKPKLKGLAKGGAVEDDQMNMYGMSPDVPSMHPKTMKDGGDVDLDGDMDSELESMIGDELMEAFEKKDKAGILEAIKALVMSCGGKV